MPYGREGFVHEHFLLRLCKGFESEVQGFANEFDMIY